MTEERIEFDDGSVFEGKVKGGKLWMGERTNADGSITPFEHGKEHETYFPDPEPYFPDPEPAGEQLDIEFEKFFNAIYKKPILESFAENEHELGKRRPKWNKKELLLAVTFYHKYPYPEWKDFPEEDVELLREKINRVSEAERTYGSVKLKLMNFRAIEFGGAKGMKNYGKTDKEVWKEYQTGELLSEVLENITSDVLDVDEIEYTAKEGKRTKSESAHYRYERDPKLRELKIKEFLTNYDSIHCEICSFDFEAKYGKRGREYIECHHTIPVSEMKENHISKISELILLCSNCHRMVHRKKPWLTPDELRNIVKK